MGKRPETFQGLAEEIMGYRSLSPGWNSYRAPAISQRAVDRALAVVQQVMQLHAPLPMPSPTSLGGVALVWALKNLEMQLLIDEESFDYSVSQAGVDKLLDEESLQEVKDVESRFIKRYLVPAA